MRNLKVIWRILLGIGICLLYATTVSNVAAKPPRIHITEFPLPSDCDQPEYGGCVPGSITAGPDGALWFVEYEGKQIGRITTAGEIQEFPVPTTPSDLAFGIDGNVWFTDGGEHIGRMTLEGQTTLFKTPTPFSSPNSIIVGPDHNLWFTEQSANAIGKITLSGEITEYPLPTLDNGPTSIIVGFDGNLWFTMYYTSKIGKMTLQGEVTEYPIPNSGIDQCGTSCFPTSILRDFDGKMWFAESGRNWISTITIAGEFQQFDLGLSSVYPNGMTLALGPDGKVWFADENERLGKINKNGKFKIYPLDLQCGKPQCSMGSIALGSDRNVWFTEWHGNQIGRLDCPPRLLLPAHNALIENQHVTFQWSKSPCAKSYAIEVRQDSAQGPIVDYAKYLKTPKWEIDLPRGHTYFWFVSACGWSCKSKTRTLTILP